MSKTKDWESRERAVAALTINMDITFKRANEILEMMDQEVKEV